MAKLTEQYKRLCGLPYDPIKLIAESMDMHCTHCNEYLGKASECSKNELCGNCGCTTPNEYGCDEEEEVDAGDNFDNMDPNDTPLTDREADPTDADMSVAMDPGAEQLAATLSNLIDDEKAEDDIAAADEQVADEIADQEGGEEDGAPSIELELPDEEPGVDLDDEDMEGMDAADDADAYISDDTPDDVEVGGDEDMGDDDGMNPNDEGKSTEQLGDEIVDLEARSIEDEEEETFDQTLNAAPSIPDFAKKDVDELQHQMDVSQDEEWLRHRDDLEPVVNKAIERAASGDLSALNTTIQLFSNLKIAGEVFQELRQLSKVLTAGNVSESCLDGTCNDTLEVAIGLQTAKPHHEEEEASPKVKFPADCKRSLNDAIEHYKKEFTDEMEIHPDGSRDAGDHQHRVEILTKIKDCLDKDQMEYDKAVHFMNTLKGDLIRCIPDDVYSFLTHGGNTGRSLKDYFNEVRGNS